MTMATVARFKVRDLMTEQLYTVRPDNDLATVKDLMVEHRIRHIPVVDPEENLVGLVSHRDLLRHSLIEQEEVPAYVEEVVLEQVEVREVMTPNPDTITADVDIREAAQILLDRKYGCLPVVEGSRLVGILTESDFVRLMARGD
jgi:CBS domain-containing membrane protein